MVNVSSKVLPESVVSFMNYISGLLSRAGVRDQYSST